MNRHLLFRGLAAAALLVVARPLATSASAAPRSPARLALPDRLSDAEFWKLENDLSEPGGYFRIEDNFTSNEMEVGELYTMLRDKPISGDVYMGVGPEQNFTYMAAIRPRMAFIVDIRRQAVMQHLMFKAVFELAKDRADFISILFAKPRPAGLDSALTIQKLWEIYLGVPRDSALRTRNRALIIDRLTHTHAFTFTADESAKLNAVIDAFMNFGPGITTRGSASGRGGAMTFADLTGYSFDAKGQAQSFLSSESNYQYIKSLQEKNLVVPVSGDFGGPKAIRAIAAYLKEHGGVVRAFYLSNVEQYLFGDGKQKAFYDNVATLPIDTSSVFIRPYSMRRGAMGGGTTLSLCPIAPFLRAFAAGLIYTNNQALQCLMASP